MKKKFNPELLNEELKKFRLMSEYSFYTGENDLNKKEDDLLLGNVAEEDDSENKDDLEAVEVDDAADAVASELGVDAETPGNDDSDMSGDIGDTQLSDTDVEAPAPEPAPAGDEVEVDVTALVKGSEEAKQSADAANQNTGQLLQKFSELESRVAAMDKINAKIDDLEKEIVKRSPTPVEKLEMRSLNSFPYSLKLTDYWAEKEGAYDVTGQGEAKKEYVLTKDDVDYGYSDSSIKQSFNVKPGETNDYEEENI